MDTADAPAGAAAEDAVRVAGAPGVKRTGIDPHSPVPPVLGGTPQPRSAPAGPGTSDTAERPQQDGKPRDGSGTADRNALVRQVAAGLGNVAVVSALLVYFGWVRSDVHARRLGIDESILGMSTREYLLRSVRPVLVLLLVVAFAGLAWLALDRRLALRCQRHGTEDRVYRLALRLIPGLVVALPLLAWAAGFVWRAAAFVLFPLSLAGGLLLVLYGLQLRQALPGALPLPPGRESLLRACTGVVVGVALFAAASNYATVEGTRLADRFVQELDGLPGVVVYSDTALNIDAPGVAGRDLSAEGGAGFRYEGLLLLERTGGRHFLVSEGWTPQHGVVVVLRDDAPGLRFEFVRDRR